MRRLGAPALLTVLVLAVAACTGDDLSSAPTTTGATTTTFPARPAQAVARDALLGRVDAPDGWGVESSSPISDLAAVCRDVQAERRRTERRAGGAPASAAVTLRAPVGLPAVRVEVSAYSTARGAGIAFDQRAGERSAHCTAKAAVRTLAASSNANVAPADVRPARAGRLGDEAKSWVVTTRVEREGVMIEVRLERVTFRVDRVIVTVLMASSPSFPLSGEVRAKLLAATVTQAVAALETA